MCRYVPIARAVVKRRQPRLRRDHAGLSRPFERPEVRRTNHLGARNRLRAPRPRLVHHLTDVDQVVDDVRLGQRVILMSSKPGRIIREWPIKYAQPRRIESNTVAQISAVITDELRKEIRRHA